MKKQGSREVGEQLEHKTSENYINIASVSSFIKSGKLVLVPNVQNEITSNYVADMAKYANAPETVKIRACFNSIPAQLAKENTKFQYKVIQKGSSAALFGASIVWLTQAGIVLKCQKIEHAQNPISVYSDLSSFKLYMCDVGLLVMKSGLAQLKILAMINDIDWQVKHFHGGCY